MKKRLFGYRQALEEFDVEFRQSLVFEDQIDYERVVLLSR